MGKILVAEQDGVKVLKFVGDVRVALSPTLSDFVQELDCHGKLHSVVIDLTETDAIDSTSLGLMAKISLKSQEVFHCLPTIISCKPDINRILVSMGFDNVFVIVNDASGVIGPLGELPTQMVSEDALREQVLESHRVLMSLSRENEDRFRDLVHALEMEHRMHKHRLHRRRMHVIR